MLELLRRVNREGKFRLSKGDLKAIAGAAHGDETAALRLLEEYGAQLKAERKSRKRRKGTKTMKRKRKGGKRSRRTKARKGVRRCRRGLRRSTRKGRKTPMQFVGNVSSIVLTRSTESAPRVIRQGGMKLYVPKNGGKSAVIRGLKSEK